jgi:hypothetical protein
MRELDERITGTSRARDLHVALPSVISKIFVLWLKPRDQIAYAIGFEAFNGCGSWKGSIEYGLDGVGKAEALPHAIS